MWLVWLNVQKAQHVTKKLTNIKFHSPLAFYQSGFTKCLTNSFMMAYNIKTPVFTESMLICTSATVLTRLESIPAPFSFGHFVTTFWWQRLCTTHVHTTEQTRKYLPEWLEIQLLYWNIHIFKFKYIFSELQSISLWPDLIPPTFALYRPLKLSVLWL